MKYFKLFEGFVQEQEANENQDAVNESAMEIALGIVGGVAGLYALAGTLNILSSLTLAFGKGIGNQIRAATKKADTKARRELISGITAKFDGDRELEAMYSELPQYSPKTAAARTKKLNEIAKYIKSKLTEDELKYFTDISSMLRTGDIKEY
jgi:hypothetical protein